VLSVTDGKEEERTGERCEAVVEVQFFSQCLKAPQQRCGDAMHVVCLPPLLALFPRLGLLVRIPEGVQEEKEEEEDGGDFIKYQQHCRQKVFRE
jgi:hypothetical protein